MKCLLIKASTNRQVSQALLQYQLLFRKRDSIQQSGLHDTEANISNFPSRLVEHGFVANYKKMNSSAQLVILQWDLSNAGEGPRQKRVCLESLQLPQLSWAIIDKIPKWERLKLNEWWLRCIWLILSGQHLSRASLQWNQSHGCDTDAVLCWRHWRLGWSNSWRRGLFHCFHYRSHWVWLLNQLAKKMHIFQAKVLF